MKKIVFLFILFSWIIGYAESSNPIQKLKNGALLVRLQTNEHLINYYLNNLDEENAKLEIQKQEKKNIHIIESFQKEWSFCPVYFFYSNHYSEVQNKNFKHVFKDIYKTPLKTDEKKKLKNSFLIAYIGKNPGTIKFNALVLTDENLKRLSAKTPRYVRTYRGLWFLKRKLKKTIQILQKKILFHELRIK